MSLDLLMYIQKINKQKNKNIIQCYNTILMLETNHIARHISVDCVMKERAICSCMVEYLLLMQWVITSILHGGPFEIFFFSFQTVLYNWYSNCMCYPVCGVVHINVPLLLTGNSSPCGGGRWIPLTI